MAIEIKSFNQILGDMIRKIVAETPLNDINAGSILLSLLEACATNDFENNAAILNVLELLNIDVIKNNDLDARAADFGLTRRAAIKASGLVSVLNTNITKRSTGLYVIKPAPIAGQTVIYVNNTIGWASTGSLYIGRGTESFEGPITYTSIATFPTYSAITLASALQKDHLISDSVIDSQGETDRIIVSGTVVKIAANNQNPEIQYTVLRDAVIPAGEDHVDDVDVIASVPGSNGNAPINTITQFDLVPFDGAGVTNTSSFSNGQDVETDTELRNRLKSYSVTLARGTAPSILSAVIGVSDPDDSKQVASAVLTEPVKVGAPSIMYIDDGSGFQPSYAGQSVDRLLNNANGGEEFLQLANYPIPRPQVVNTAEGPFAIKDGSFLRVVIDGEEETIFFSADDFLNISAATTPEVVVAINNASTLFKARFTDESEHVLLYPVEHDAEIIQVSSIKTTDDETFYVNSLLKFPTNEFSYISLYQNSSKLHEKARSAELDSSPFATWNITTSGNIVISVDNTPAQDRTFALSDFPGIASFAALSLENWVAAFNKKFAGLTATVTPSQTMKIASNRSGEDSSIVVNGGTYLNKWFPNAELSSQGQSAQFQLNRQTGNLRILTDIEAGDNITAGVEDAKGFLISSVTTSSTYNVSSDGAGRPSEMVIVVDADKCVKREVTLLIGSTVTISDQGSSVMRIMGSTLEMFQALQPGDFIYIVKKSSGWFSNQNVGLYKIIAKGEHTTAATDSYVEVLNDTIVAESKTVTDAQDIKAFVTDGYPQIWRGSYTNNPPAEPISDVVDSINDNIMGVKAAIFRSNSIKLTSATENSGSIAIPISAGNAGALFSETAEEEKGNAPHIANRISDKSLVTFFRRYPATGTNVWLNRHVATDVKGQLTANSVPSAAPFSSTYSETIESTGVLNTTNAQYKDLVAFTKGNNKGQLRSIKSFISGDQVGTQQSTPRTEFDHIENDEFQVLKSLEFSSDDSIVVVMDNDPSVKTVDIRMARTGRVNSGSNAISFSPTTTEFSANDFDNEPNIDFSNPTVWDTTLNGTDFSDYAVWMRAHNWYVSGGVGSGLGSMILRAAQFGPNGERVRFSIDYPTNPEQDNTTTFKNTPSYSQFTYFFGSGPAVATAISDGDSIAVKGPYPDTSTNFPNGVASSGNYFDYTFSAGSLASVNIGDVLSILDTAGVSVSNRGQFAVLAKNGNTIRVYNPSASNTTPGAAEVSTFTTIADILGTPTSYTVNTVADVAGSLDGKYFLIHDTAGSVAIWFDLNNDGTTEPSHGANRSIKIATIINDDGAAAIANKIYQYLLQDGAFSVTGIGNQLTIVNVQNGNLPAGSVATSGFTLGHTAGTDDQSLDGKYLMLNDQDGSVAVWFDVGGDGTPEPFHGADRSIEVTGIQYGDSATTVAAAIAAAINTDSEFSASSVGNQLTVTNAFDGNSVNATVETSGFSVAIVGGSLPTNEVIVNSNSLFFLPLTNKTVNDICTKINESVVMTATPVGNGNLMISKATKEDAYTYAGNSTALAYGHNPSDVNVKDFVKLYDGENWVKSFQNSNPNFVMKKAFTLNGVAPSAYTMSTCPNFDTLDVGEIFKLIPTTIKNVHHHMTQKALSQLPIVSNVDISNDKKNVQIRSKQLGSQGSIELVGGSGNKAKAYFVGESEIANDASGNYLLVKVPAFPDTFNIGDTIQIENDAGVRRLSRLVSTDKITVANPSSGIIEYHYNPKATNFATGTTFTITDVSASYGRPATTVWRWTHGGGGPNLNNVQPGDLLMAFGTLTGWDQGNKAMNTGDGQVAGLPIVAVNDASNWVDIVNPHGKAMASTAVGASSTVQICPTPIIKWNLDHAARIEVASITRTGGNLVSVNCIGPHFLNSGDSVDVIDSDGLADNIYANITVTGINSFTFASVGSNFSEGEVNASIIKSTKTNTRYKIEKLGYNGFTRLSVVSGESPRFVDCGVALDDYLVIGGSTFGSNNNGRFRVLAVDNNSIIYVNDESTDELDTVVKFNNKDMLANWVSNSNLVTGLAGTFKNVNVGDWVKKEEDEVTSYRQVISFNTGVPSTATQISLGGNYIGTTGTAAGVSFDQNTDVGGGLYLKGTDDVAIYEGDSVVIGDTLSVQNIVNTSWFDVNNIGNFIIAEIGSDGVSRKPFLRISSSTGVAETDVLMSVDPAGFYITESLLNKFYSIRQVAHVSFDDINQEKRSIYLTPHSRSYKFSNANKTSISHLGKLGYSTDVTSGIDGYLYYTGLLRRVQRIVDGYEPDSDNFPGRRAVGGLIEILPPLNKSIIVSLDVTTDEGVNLGDISNNIKSTVINYVDRLNVGEDVILSEIIAAVMQIKGIGAVTFTEPTPSTERITIADNEKATILPENIGIA